MAIVNLTPHIVNIVGKPAILPEAEPARVSSTTTPVGEVEGYPLFRTEFGEVVGLPPYQEGVYHIVSRVVAAALPGRKNLLVPSGLVRGEGGKVTGAKGFEAP